MPTQAFKFVIPKNENIVISPSELLEIYFFGIPMKTQDGKQMADHVIKTYIRSAQEEVEGYLNIKINKQVIEERRDFNREDYRDWGFVRTSYPVVEPLSLIGNINDVQQVLYPVEWLSARTSSDGIGHFRNLYLVPSGTKAAQYSGITPHVGYFGAAHIPQYWKVRYCTGFESVPADILNIIGKMASINLFHIMGDLILGAGIASQSIGIDGLSQSISTTSSATNAGYGARVTGYLDDLKIGLPRLKAKYDGFEMISL
jgi:hypothetical protein